MKGLTLITQNVILQQVTQKTHINVCFRKPVMLIQVRMEYTKGCQSIMVISVNQIQRRILVLTMKHSSQNFPLKQSFFEMLHQVKGYAIRGAIMNLLNHLGTCKNSTKLCGAWRTEIFKPFDIPRNCGLSVIYKSSRHTLETSIVS